MVGRSNKTKMKLLEMMPTTLACVSDEKKEHDYSMLNLHVPAIITQSLNLGFHSLFLFTSLDFSIDLPAHIVSLLLLYTANELNHNGDVYLGDSMNKRRIRRRWSVLGRQKRK